MASTLVEGTDVWVACPQNVWRSGRITRCKEHEIVIDVDTECASPLPEECQSRRRTEALTFPRDTACKNQKLLRRNPELFGLGALEFEDLKDVPDLHEAAVLHAVQTRYKHNKIYTCSGPILLAVNPYRAMPALYSMDVLQNFMVAHSNNQPHVFGIAKAAFYGIAEGGKSQTVLISGESGAGKTETTKFVMQFLALAGKGDAPCASSVEHQVLASNPLLEAFGNAKTLRNDNSSRFGKYIELQFHSVEVRPPRQQIGADDDKEDVGLPPLRLIGARIRTYLLEKVRIADQQEGERSFHIFYQVLAAAAQLPSGNEIYIPSGPRGRVESASDITRSGRPSLKDLGLSPTASPHASPRGASVLSNAADLMIDLHGFAGHSVKDFDYLTKSSCTSLSGKSSWNLAKSKYTTSDVDEAADFCATLEAMRNMGLSGIDISMIFRSLAAVLHLGNVVFETPPKNSEASQIKGGFGGSLATACSLLGVEAEEIANALCLRTMQAPGERAIRKQLSCTQAQEGRDALARHLYNAVFRYVVRQTNESIGSHDNAMFVGLLDIFGFEFFKRNSFEQLCINFTNELLQQHFNEFTFETEQELYAQEGIQWNPLDFPDNRPIVELLNRKPQGIFPMLDEECITVGGTSSTWCQKLCNQYGSKKHPNFSQILQRQNVFTVHHFAGPVEYAAAGFLEKNRDELSQDLMKCLKASANTFVAARFHENDRLFGTQESAISGTQEVDASPDSRRRPMKARAYSVSREFREQLQGLMIIIKSTAPHFVRCIKPNSKNAPLEFDRLSVAEQLRYQGVLQAIKMSRSGFPIRMFHRECFWDFRYFVDRVLRERLEYQASRTGEYQVAVKRLLEALDGEVLKNMPNGWAVGKTRVFLRQEPMNHLSAGRVRLQNKCATKIRASWKMHVGRIGYLLCRFRFIRFQARVRGVRARAEVRKLRQHQAALEMQCCARSFLLRSMFVFTGRSACEIQSWARMRPYRTQYLYMRACALKLQLWWRSKLRLVRLRRLRRNLIKVQSVWRGRQGRRHAEECRRQLHIKTVVLVLQRIWRGYLGRRYAKDFLAQIHRRKLAVRALVRIRVTRLMARQRREEILASYRNSGSRAQIETRNSYVQRLALQEENARLLDEVQRLRTELVEVKSESNAMIERLNVLERFTPRTNAELVEIKNDSSAIKERLDVLEQSTPRTDASTVIERAKSPQTGSEGLAYQSEVESEASSAASTPQQNNASMPMNGHSPFPVSCEEIENRTVEAKSFGCTSRIAEHREAKFDLLRAPASHQSSGSVLILVLTYVFAICFAFYCSEAGTQSSGTTVMITDVPVAGCLDCGAPNLHASADEFSESEASVPADASTDVLVDESLQDAPQDHFSGVGQSVEDAGNGGQPNVLVDESLHDALLDDFSGVGHSVEDAGIDGQPAEDPQVAPKKTGTSPWSITAGSVMLATALRWLHGFQSLPSATIRHW